MAILVVIMAAIYGSFSTAQRNVKQAEAARDETDLARTLLAKLTDDLTNTYLNPSMTVTSPTTNQTFKPTILYGKKEEAGEGNEQTRHDSLTLTTLTNFHTPGTKETELLEAGYFFREKPDGTGYTLFRREKRDLSAAPPLEGGDEYELTDRVGGLQLRYYTGTQWVDEWDTRKLGGLPRAVEITLTLASGKVYITEADVSRQ